MKFYLVTINAENYEALIPFCLPGNTKNNTSWKILKARTSF